MGMWTAASSQPDSVSPTHPVGETVTMTEALSAKEDSEIKKKKLMYIVPNHVLLVISLGYPRILSSLIKHISQAFMKRSTGSHSVHPGG